MRMSLTLYHRQIANIDFRTPGSPPFVSLSNIIATHYKSALFAVIRNHLYIRHTERISSNVCCICYLPSNTIEQLRALALPGLI